jgi:hypothetical protein
MRSPLITFAPDPENGNLSTKWGKQAFRHKAKARKKHERHEIKQEVALARRLAHWVSIRSMESFEFFRVFRAFRGQLLF